MIKFPKTSKVEVANHINVMNVAIVEVACMAMFPVAPVATLIVYFTRPVSKVFEVIEYDRNK